MSVAQNVLTGLIFPPARRQRSLTTVDLDQSTLHVRGKFGKVLTVSPDKLPSMKIDITIVGGKILYDRNV